MSYCAGLTCVSATLYSNLNIVLINCLCSYKRLTNDNLKCLKTKVLIDVSLVDCNISLARY